MTITASPATSMPRRLPRSLTPLPDETLAGYVLNLAHRLDLAPAELAERIALIVDSRGLTISTGYIVALPQVTATNIGRGCGLTPDEVRNLTLTRWDGLLFDSDAPGKAARTLHGNAWLNPTRTRACPHCLADTPTSSPDRVLWQAAWRTPWAVACTRHEVLLNDTCGACAQPYGQSGHRLNSLIPNPAAAAAHPASCRASNAHGQGLCGQRLDEQPTIKAPAAVLAVQARLDAVLNGTLTAPTSLGMPVAPAQYLRDLRVLSVLHLLADARSPDSALPAAFTDALHQHQQARQTQRLSRPDNDRSDRTWTTPPGSTTVLAALLVQASSILDLPTAADARDVLPPLITAATSHERLLWHRIRSTGQPSDGLFRYFAPRRAGTLSTHMLRTATTTSQGYTITATHVPGYLDQARYERWFSTFTPAAENNIRRAVPLAVAQLIEQIDLPAAAGRLGIPAVAAQAAVIRTGRVCKPTGRDDEFRALIHTVALDLQTNPINYERRRQHLDNPWALPDQDWTAMQTAMLNARLARTDTPWPQRRQAVTVWVWSLVTGSDPVLAPHLQDLTVNGRRSTNGAIDAYSTLLRRARPPLTRIVIDYATRLADQIDAS